MAQEKTEKATPKRREDARKKGQVARGAEMPAALGFLGAVLAFGFLGWDISERTAIYLKTTFARLSGPSDFGQEDLNIMAAGAIFNLLLISVPIIAAAMAGALAGNLVQGVSVSGASLKPKAERFNPAANLKRAFGGESFINLLKTIAKLLFLSSAAYISLSPLIIESPALINAPPQTIALKLSSALYNLAFLMGSVMAGLAIADYGYAYYKHEKSLKMTKQEIRDEFKESEGDPAIKSQRRRSARALLQSRSIADVPSATVVVTNPTHFAVALRYDHEKDPAPIVVAKGADKMAARIREAAREHSIPLVENKPLARALYKLGEPNKVIPIEFFGAVAEILAFILRSKNENN